ncbi:MAG: zf-HC2 domain-containing protein [Candidatus Sumerlaeia bacterium]|nr:zf-HC2 domain-containing protein [Candidatus Sumerlaeia bacterium]
MNCDREKLAAHVLGELDDKASVQMQAHIAECAACAQRAAELRATVGLLRSLPDAPARPVALGDLCASAMAEENAERRKAANLSQGASRRLARWGVALAAASLLALLCARYGVAVRIGQWEVAFGGRVGAVATPGGQAFWSEDAIRTVVQEELTAQVQPALLELAQTLGELESSHQAGLLALRNALLLQRENDMNEVKRTFGVFASTVNETLGIR